MEGGNRDPARGGSTCNALPARMICYTDIAAAADDDNDEDHDDSSGGNGGW